MNHWKKDVAAWKCGDTLYLSVPFTWLLPRAEAMAKGLIPWARPFRKGPKVHRRGRVFAGGPAVDLMGAPWANETPKECPFNALAMHNPCATFTTRGCPNRCGFCAVPKIEGDFRELTKWNPAPVICDNNILTASRAHFQRVIDAVRHFPAVDFNQGLDAARFTSWHAGQIARLYRPVVRFAFDSVSREGVVVDALATAKKAGLRRFGVYVLLGYKDTQADAYFRLEKVRAWGIRPNPMRFQPLNALTKNSYVAPGWTEYELRRMVRYYSRLRYLEHIPYKDYNPPIDKGPSLFPELPEGGPA